jgi:hypothetical protein
VNGYLHTVTIEPLRLGKMCVRMVADSILCSLSFPIA